jgi:hypothetical protein
MQNSSGSARNATRGEWLFVHTLASLSLLTLATFLVVKAYLILSGRSELYWPVFARALLGVGVIAVFWFWVRMIVDYFRERPDRNPVAWGWVVILGSALGSLPYFWFVWRTRNRPK